MSLCNVYGYLNDGNLAKTIKLSDSYQVRIRLEDYDFAMAITNATKSKYALNIKQPENNEIELFECSSVTLPTYKPKEDIFEYGNNSKSFIYMDPKSLDDLEIEVIEHYSDNNTLTIQDLVNLFLSKLFDEDKFEYILDEYIPEITVYVFSNIFDTVYLKYIFRELKLTNYTKYDLDYSSSELAKWSLKFSYRSFEVISGEELAYSEEIANNITEDTSVGDTEQVEPAETVKAPEMTLENPALTESDKTDKDQTPKQDVITETAPEAAPQEAPANDNNNLKDQFNATGSKPEGTKTSKKATDNPVDLASLSEEDRIDELAYRMMRGELDNGKPRYGKTYDAGYTENERAAAQSVVNERDWQGLKDRHDARVAAMANAVNNTEVAAAEPATPVVTDTINSQEEKPVETQVKKANNKRTDLTYDNKQYNSIKDNMSVNDLLTKHSNEKSGDYAATVASVYMDNNSRIGNSNIAGKDFVSQKTADEINATGKAKAETKQKQQTAVNSYANDDGPKYLNGVQDKNGLTLNQWAYLTAKNDYEAEENKEAKNKKGYKGYNFSLGSTAVPMKQKMEYQKRYHEEMEKLQNPSVGAASYSL